jgi:hypothetical protein
MNWFSYLIGLITLPVLYGVIVLIDRVIELVYRARKVYKWWPFSWLIFRFLKKGGVSDLTHPDFLKWYRKVGRHLMTDESAKTIEWRYTRFTGNEFPEDLSKNSDQVKAYIRRVKVPE